MYNFEGHQATFKTCVLLRRPVPRLRFMSGLLHPSDRITSSAHKEPVSWKIVGDCASQRCSPETSKFSQESMWRLEKAWQTSEQAFQIGTFPLRIRSAGRCVHPGSSFSPRLKFDSDIFSQGAPILLCHLGIILQRNTTVFQNRVMRCFFHGPDNTRKTTLASGRLALTVRGCA